MQVPDVLYRGDRDKDRLRQVQQYWDSGWLVTNLSAGGRGREVFTAPLVERVRQHVDYEWDRTHFLSFTPSQVVGEHFAQGQTGMKLQRVEDSAASWDTSIFVLECARLSSREVLAPGIMRAKFAHRPWEGAVTPESVEVALPRIFQDHKGGGKEVPILVVDVVTCLDALESDDPVITAAREKAHWDQEWLVLPLEPYIPEVDGRRLPSEFSAKLDDSCISGREKYLLVP